ncbi:YggS family pyridoxal phosphate enzyme [Clostridia bacterium]|nr:YggS family pyridoxal phosphate enzyme [Clostridia bacterium]
MDYSQIERNIVSVKERAAKAAGGREVMIVAATKTVSADVVRRLPALGIDTAGENRVQEFLEKYDILKNDADKNENTLNGADAPQSGNGRQSVERSAEIPTRLNFHFIGRLQTNKVKYIADKVSLIHSVDRPELAAEISRVCRVRNIPNMDILIEVNAGGEENKGGIAPDRLLAFACETAEKHPNLIVRGMMPVLPIGADEKLYLQMTALYDIFKRECPTGRWLSMGMSNDFERAVRCGANMVRIGSAIFGGRQA